VSIFLITSSGSKQWSKHRTSTYVEDRDSIIRNLPHPIEEERILEQAIDRVPERGGMRIADAFVPKPELIRYTSQPGVLVHQPVQ